MSLEKVSYKICGNPGMNILYYLITDFILHKLPVNTEVLGIKSYRVQMHFPFLFNVCIFLEIKENFHTY